MAGRRSGFESLSASIWQAGGRSTGAFAAGPFADLGAAPLAGLGICLTGRLGQYLVPTWLPHRLPSRGTSRPRHRTMGIGGRASPRSIQARSGEARTRHTVDAATKIPRKGLPPFGPARNFRPWFSAPTQVGVWDLVRIRLRVCRRVAHATSPGCAQLGLCRSAHRRRESRRPNRQELESHVQRPPDAAFFARSW